jgi:hypothetical protein
MPKYILIINVVIQRSKNQNLIAIQWIIVYNLVIKKI